MPSVRKSDAPTAAEQTDARLFLETNLRRLFLSNSDKEKIRAHRPEKVSIETTREGIPNMHLYGVPVYEAENPVQQAQKQVNLIEGEDTPNVAVLFGLGLGYHAEQMERRYACPIVIFDPSLDAVACALGRRMFNLKNTVLVTDIPHLIAETQPRLQFNDAQIVAAAVPAYQQLFPQEFHDYVQALKLAKANARILEDTTTIRSSNWMQLAVQNIPRAADKASVDILMDKFVGKPGIVVSAGPSLDKNIGRLKDAQGRAVIVAVNAAAAPLARAGIKPDIIAVVEGLDLRTQLEGLPWLQDVVLVPSLSSFPGFFDLDARRILPMADNSVICSDWFSSAYNWQQFSSGGSVACTAFSLLFSFGCDPIILVGQDLAYTDGKSYAGSATFGAQTMRYDASTNKLVAMESERNRTLETIRTEGGLSVLDNLNAIEVEAFGGTGTVHTIGIFNLFRSWFEGAAESWAKDRRLINATEGGSRIRRFEEMSLAEALAAYCTEPVATAEIIEDTARAVPKNNIGALRSEISDDLSIIDAIVDLAERAKQTAAAALDELNGGGIPAADSLLRRLARLEAELGRLTADNRIVDGYISGKVNQLRVERFKDRDEDIHRQTANSVHRTSALMDLITEGCRELKDLFVPLISQLEQMES